jgi:predicted TIM-barrel fold metal-dependent hydrolase
MSEWKSKLSGVIDSHVHMGSMDEEAAMEAIRLATGIDRIGLVSIQDPESGTGLPQSLFMKARHPQHYFVFAGLNHAAIRSGGRVSTPSLSEQVDLYVDIGCDGLKMIEGKPTSRQVMDIPVTDPYFADYWAHVEETGLPIVWHVNDPEEFWDPATTPGWAKEHDWGYGPDDVAKEQLYTEVDEVLARHPGLRITFAHFYFLSADLPRARRFLDAHPSISLDLAPGIEMLYNMSRDVDASRQFFVDYADRIIFGTDLFSSLSLAEGQYRAGIVFRWLESQDTFRVPTGADFILGPPEDGVIHGMSLPDDALKKIYRSNYTALTGGDPSPLDVGKAIEQCQSLAAMSEAMSGKPAAETEAARVALALGD